MDLTHLKQQVKHIIKDYDINNRIKGKDLSKRLGIAEVTLREVVNELRNEEFPIGSDSEGYFHAKSETELQHTIAQILSRVSKMVKAVNGLQRCYKSKELNLFEA